MGGLEQWLDMTSLELFMSVDLVIYIFIYSNTY